MYWSGRRGMTLAGRRGGLRRTAGIQALASSGNRAGRAREPEGHGRTVGTLPGSRPGFAKLWRPLRRDAVFSSGRPGAQDVTTPPTQPPTTTSSESETDCRSPAWPGEAGADELIGEQG